MASYGSAFARGLEYQPGAALGGCRRPDRPQPRQWHRAGAGAVLTVTSRRSCARNSRPDQALILKQRACLKLGTLDGTKIIIPLDFGFPAIELKPSL